MRKKNFAEHDALLFVHARAGGRGGIDFPNNLAVGGGRGYRPTETTRREARGRRPPLAGDAAGGLAACVGGVDVGERRGRSGRRVHHRRGPPPARRRPHPLPR